LTPGQRSAKGVGGGALRGSGSRWILFVERHCVLLACRFALYSRPHTDTQATLHPLHIALLLHQFFSSRCRHRPLSQGRVCATSRFCPLTSTILLFYHQLSACNLPIVLLPVDVPLPILSLLPTNNSKLCERTSQFIQVKQASILPVILAFATILTRCRIPHTTQPITTSLSVFERGDLSLSLTVS